MEALKVYWNREGIKGIRGRRQKVKSRIFHRHGFNHSYRLDIWLWTVSHHLTPAHDSSSRNRQQKRLIYIFYEAYSFEIVKFSRYNHRISTFDISRVWMQMENASLKTSKKGGEKKNFCLTWKVLFGRISELINSFSKNFQIKWAKVFVRFLFLYIRVKYMYMYIYFIFYHREVRDEIVMGMNGSHCGTATHNNISLEFHSVESLVLFAFVDRHMVERSLYFSPKRAERRLFPGSPGLKEWRNQETATGISAGRNPLKLDSDRLSVQSDKQG